jgi:hypothetical protein
MGRGMITRPIWKCPCIKLFITYFRHIEKRHPYWPETKLRPILARQIWASIWKWSCSNPITGYFPGVWKYKSINEIKLYFDFVHINRHTFSKYNNLMSSKSMYTLSKLCKFIRIVNKRICPLGWSTSFHNSIFV